MKQRTDTERLDAIAKEPGVGIIHNDMAHWAVACDGMQNLPSENYDEPFDLQTTFLIEKTKFRPTIRQAIDAYLDEQEAESLDDNSG